MADQPSQRFKVLSMDPPVKSYVFQQMLDRMKDFYADMREELDIHTARIDKLVLKVAKLEDEARKAKRRK